MYPLKQPETEVKSPVTASNESETKRGVGGRRGARATGIVSVASICMQNAHEMERQVRRIEKRK